jgi:outer membrane protein TolC
MTLAKRRVESTTLLLEAGKASTRDRLEAESALVRARNGTTLALVDYASARLALLSDVGILAVGSDATWTPVPPAPDAPEGPVLDLPAVDPEAPTGPLPDPMSVEPESVPPASDG